MMDTCFCAEVGAGELTVQLTGDKNSAGGGGDFCPGAIVVPRGVRRTGRDQLPDFTGALCSAQ